MPRSRPLDRLALRLYQLALYAYPAPFRRAFGDELAQVFRDMYEEARDSSSHARMARLWARALSDLLWSAGQEWSHDMRPLALATTLLTGIAFVVSLLASLNLYLLEDQNPLTLAAYRASPLLRLTYDAAYLSALVAGAMVCAAIVRVFAPNSAVATVTAGGIALVVALGGFGGLLLKAPLTFLPLFVGFTALTLVCFFVSERATVRLRRSLVPRMAAAVGGCVGVGAALAVNVVALAPHTIALNPASHALYMQGQIAGTHFNSLLLGMALQLLLVCMLEISVGGALRAPRTAQA